MPEFFIHTMLKEPQVGARGWTYQHGRIYVPGNLLAIALNPVTVTMGFIPSERTVILDPDAPPQWDVHRYSLQAGNGMLWPSRPLRDWQIPNGHHLAHYNYERDRIEFAVETVVPPTLDE